MNLNELPTICICDTHSYIYNVSRILQRIQVKCFLVIIVKICALIYKIDVKSISSLSQNLHKKSLNKICNQFGVLKSVLDKEVISTSIFVCS